MYATFFCFFIYAFRLGLHTCFCYATRATSRNIVIRLLSGRGRKRVKVVHKRWNQMCVYVFLRFNISYDSMCNYMIERRFWIVVIFHRTHWLQAIHSSTVVLTREPRLVEWWNNRSIELQTRLKYLWRLLVTLVTITWNSLQYTTTTRT